MKDILIKKETKKEYRKRIRAYHREQISKIKKGNLDVIFETSKNRFSDIWNWD